MDKERKKEFTSKSNTGLAFMSRGQTTRIKREKYLSGHIGKALLNTSLFMFSTYKFRALHISERKKSARWRSSLMNAEILPVDGGRGLETFTVYMTRPHPLPSALLHPTASTIH
jgi:hypothetical protein